jgi:hypothetical protein
MTTPRRRWFRFSLRTLFVVVTVLAIGLSWVAYQLNWIRERHKALGVDGSDPMAWVEIPSRRAPWSLRIFGEFGSAVIVPFHSSDRARLRSLFPEATIVNFQEHSPATEADLP